VILDDTLTFNEYLFSNLITGTTYAIKVEATNAYGFSDYSDTLILQVGTEPFAVIQPSYTSTTPGYVTFNWNQPYDNGSPITNYKIMV
jgi:hypothetical protein